MPSLLPVHMPCKALQGIESVEEHFFDHVKPTCQQKYIY